jgi:hypothetical protein
MVMAKTRRKGGRTRKYRASGRGRLTFGLVASPACMASAGKHRDGALPSHLVRDVHACQ